MTTKNTKRDAARRANLTHMRRQIGSTVYEVSICFNQDEKETMEEKLLRIIRNDLNAPAPHAIMAVPQTDRLPERRQAA